MGGWGAHVGLSPCFCSDFLILPGFIDFTADEVVSSRSGCGWGSTSPSLPCSGHGEGVWSWERSWSQGWQDRGGFGVGGDACLCPLSGVGETPISLGLGPLLSRGPITGGDLYRGPGASAGFFPDPPSTLHSPPIP